MNRLPVYGDFSPNKFKSAMKSKLIANGLSKRKNRCLATTGIVIEKKAIVNALKTGNFFLHAGRPSSDESRTWKFVVWPELTRNLCPSLGSASGHRILKMAFPTEPTIV